MSEEKTNKKLPSQASLKYARQRDQQQQQQQQQQRANSPLLRKLQMTYIHQKECNEDND